MANKYAQGNYIITTFDFYGSKVKTIPATDHTFIQSVEEGRAICDSDADVTSFTVSRVLFNSKTKQDD